MERMAGMHDTGDETAEAAGTAGLGTETETDTSAEAGGASSGVGKAGSRRGVLLILAGLVVAGIAAGYNWARSLPKD